MTGRANHLTLRTRAVLEAIRAADAPVTAFEVAARMGEHPNTIRHLVNHLADIGQIVVDHVAPPARGGRPASHYVVRGWVPAPVVIAPRADVASAWLAAPIHQEAA